MRPLQRAQNHLVLPGTAEGSHHRGHLAMRSGLTGETLEDVRGTTLTPAGFYQPSTTTTHGRNIHTKAQGICMTSDTNCF